jgi:hypothetical protein
MQKSIHFRQKERLWASLIRRVYSKIHHPRPKGAQGQCHVHQDSTGQIDDDELACEQDTKLCCRRWVFLLEQRCCHCAGWLAAMTISIISQPPYSPDLAPGDCFVFLRMISELAGISVVQETFKNPWDWVLRIITKKAFAAALWRWKGRCEKCV